MKNLGFTLLLLLISTCLQAQDTQDYYVGTWKWEDQSSNSEIIVKLRTYTGVWGFFGDESIYTILVGAYSYKKDDYGALKRIAGSSRVVHVQSNPHRIKWVLSDDARKGEVIADPKLLVPQGISLPKEIVLTKVE